MSNKKQDAELTYFGRINGDEGVVSCPSYVDSDKIDISENGLTVLRKRYIRKSSTGDELETVGGMFYRVARCVADVETQYGKNDSDNITEIFYNLMSEMRFLPNSPTFTGAGTPLGQLAACFVLPISDDMGKKDDGIFSTLRVAALIQQTGGGNGFSFSNLRPRGDFVQASSGRATGPVGFLKVYDAAFGEIAQGGTRRGANMAVLRVDHPDIEEFIECKNKEGEITNFNISVALTDEFMKAVELDMGFQLINPRNGKINKTVRARDLFRKIAEQAHKNGEPGALFISRANKYNPVPHLYGLEATNPCGEQWLGPYENCCLGSINLARHVNFVSPVPRVDWLLLARTIRESTHFLDNVIDANIYLPSFPKISDAAKKSRRIGLGIMGLADMMYMLGIRYGSNQSQEFAAQIMEFVRYHCMDESIKLAVDRGPFEEIHGSIYDYNAYDGMKWTIPEPLVYHVRDWGRPELDWDLIETGIQDHGIRNAAQTTIAPTGTISTVAGCEGYGCEPAFALGYTRNFKDEGENVELEYTSPLFNYVLKLSDLSVDTKERILSKVIKNGSCQDIDELPDYIKNTFVVSSDISGEEHVEMQAALQAFVDNSISKTCNFPEWTTPDDVENSYMKAWKMGCKGLTVYVTSSRDEVVLETKKEKERKEGDEPKQAIKRERPYLLTGKSYKKDTPLGRAYITVNEDEDGDPFEVFVTIGKGGSNTSAVSEAIGRLLSLVLRIESSISPSDRLEWAIDELISIGSGRPLGFGNNRVGSLPDGIAQVLLDYMGGDIKNGNDIGDLCPDCGAGTLIEIEGCRKCMECGYSEC